MSSSDDEVADLREQLKAANGLLDRFERGATPLAERVEKPTPPEREKPKAEWTVEDVIAFKQTGQMPDSDDYRAYVRKVHEDAGLAVPVEVDEDREPTADEIFNQKNKAR